MRIALPLFAMSVVAACAMPEVGPEPSLAPRPAEAIDPRVPVPDTTPAGPVDRALAQRLDGLRADVRSGVPAFDAREAEASRLAAAAGAEASESWIAAQQALSRLVEQYGVTTRAAADVDGLASSRLQSGHWIGPPDREAIAAAAAEIASTSDRQAAAIGRLRDQLAR